MNDPRESMEGAPCWAAHLVTYQMFRNGWSSPARVAQAPLTCAASEARIPPPTVIAFRHFQG